MRKITKGDVVEFRCNSFLQDGSSLDDPNDSAPFKMLAGVTSDSASGITNIISKNLVDMQINENKTIEITPDEAFGTYKPELVISVPLSAIEEEVSPGDVITLNIKSQTLSAGPREGLVKSVEDESAVLDLNHPLAGETLFFEITILKVVPR